MKVNIKWIILTLTLSLIVILYFYLHETSYEPIPYNSALDEDISKKIGAKPPYGVFFSTPKTSLLYIAANHDAKLSAKTFHWIKTAFEKYSPDFVIVEGIEESKGISPQSIIDHIKNKCIPNWHCGESLYAAHLAFLNNIPFIGGEIDDKEILSILEKRNYSMQDVLFFYFTRQLPEYYRENAISSEKDIRNKFSLFTNKFSYYNYIVWLQAKLNSNNINFHTLIDSNLTAPITNGNYLQKLSSEINIIRDRHALKVIQKTQEKNNKVLVVYGASHFTTQENALTQLLGKPIYFPTIKAFEKYSVNMGK